MNKIVINDNEDLTFEVSDAYIQPLLAYIEKISKQSDNDELIETLDEYNEAEEVYDPESYMSKKERKRDEKKTKRIP